MVDEQAIWDAYNLLLSGRDTERLRKMLARYDLFRRTLDVPGDIVEAGVFKGTGLIYFLKLLTIYCPGTMKRVVGFDLFSGFEQSADDNEKEAVRGLLEEAAFQGTTVEQIAALAAQAGFGPDRCVLVEGDIGHTAAEYCKDNPGFRISLLHLDLDLGRPTRAALEALWDRVARGGVVVFDEYAVPRWTASDGIDAFFRDRSEQIEVLPWSRSPTGFVVKR